MRLLVGIITASALCLAAAPASAQQTCSQLAQECRSFNQRYGQDAVNRCKGYHASCMRTGQWVDRNRQFSNVTRK